MTETGKRDPVRILPTSSVQDKKLSSAASKHSKLTVSVCTTWRYAITVNNIKSKLGTCEAFRFNSNSNRTSRFDSKVMG